MTRREGRHLTAAHAETEAIRARIAVRIKEAQKDAGLTVEAAADAVGVSVRLYQKWRAGDNAPSWPNLVRLAQALDKPSPLWFLESEKEAA